MSATASSSLPPEIQQALQQVVGDINDAANVSKKKKKRSREERADGDEQVKRKSKKKKHSQQEVVLASAVEIAPNQLTLSSPSPAISLESVAAAPTEEHRKKKKKKDKGKQREQETPVLPQLSMEPGSTEGISTSSADFLSAVVAAASATSGHQHAPPAEFHHPMPPYPPYAPEHYLPYPPPGYPYPPQPVSYGHPPPQVPPMYPDLGGLSLPDLSLQSSEDLLRTLQDLDISKIATVLKSLGDAAAIANVSLNIPPAFLPMPPPPVPPPVRQVPARSDAILGRPPKQPKAAAKQRTVPTNIPLPEPSDEGNPEHAHMLANVWMNPAKLKEMVETQGLVFKKGKFSAIEEAQLAAAIENFRTAKGLTHEQLKDLIFSKEKGRDAFWSEITSAVHLRPIISVYHHVRRTYHPWQGKGKWMQSEDAELRAAVAQYGQQWEKISKSVGRMSADCRDRYRNHLQNSEMRQTGSWTKEEEDQLTKIVTEMTVQQGKNIDNDIFWGVVSERMGGRRGRQQCRIKWTDSLSTQYKNDGQRPRWSQLDAYILVHKVDSLNVRDDSEIDWKKLPDEHWNSWSAHSLQRRWLTMKRSIKGYEDMLHSEIMDILRTKKAQSPPPPTASRKRKNKVTSAEAIADSDSDSDSDDDDDETEQGTAGSSTGPGTLGATGIPS